MRDSNLSSQLSQASVFDLSATHFFDGSSITVDADFTPYVSGTYKLHVAVVEKLTTENTGSNGETSFKNVLMAMIPSASGTTINCVQDASQTERLSIDLSGTNIEEMSDLEVIVFIQKNASQSDSDKEVMQSARSTQSLSAYVPDSLMDVTIYPNPSNGILTIDTDKTVDFELIDLNGRIIKSIQAIDNNHTINLSSLQKGIYIAKIAKNKDFFTKRIILK